MSTSSRTELRKCMAMRCRRVCRTLRIRLLSELHSTSKSKPVWGKKHVKTGNSTCQYPLNPCKHNKNSLNISLKRTKWFPIFNGGGSQALSTSYCASGLLSPQHCVCKLRQLGVGFALLRGLAACSVPRGCNETCKGRLNHRHWIYQSY